MTTKEGEEPAESARSEIAETAETPGQGLKRIPSPHDRLFRRVLENPARAAAVLRTYLPKAITDRLSDDPPKLVDGSFVDPALRESRSDLLFEMTLATGTPLLIYTLLEHKSTPDPLTPLQIEEYKLKIWRREYTQKPTHPFKLPPILALVFYHGDRPWTVPCSIAEMIRDEDAIRAVTRSPGYQVHHVGPDGVLELAAYPDLRGIFLALYLSQVKGTQRTVARYAEIFTLLENSDLEEVGYGYIVRGVQPSRAILEEALRIVKPNQVEAIMGSFYEEALTEGRTQGLTEGRTEGMSEAFLKLAQVKYGAVPQEIAATVRQASQDKVDRWLEALVHAREIDDIFKS